MTNYIEIETHTENETEFVKSDFTLYDIEEYLNDVNKEFNLLLTLENFLPHNVKLDFEEIALYIENDYSLYNDVPFSDFLDYETLKSYKLDFSFDRFENGGF